ncbi:bifunctional 2-polyprenyl-6-hydroxyphenol methylase/3-demethylubiquinol 3-O-methyltransferase UbiG [Ruegeria sp. HKCCD8929]|uniref:class I SAM-dependent methyltransferase n=1 Tax=Ruegeria sp. HKCCD8929 TaxID=2683006 RepID=UPI001488BD58|nr:class I SAM-dependent methyltransferase [Ruegeria sp. HKCCD8929]
MTSATLSPGLQRLYARHAGRWHRSITNLGYPEAYAMLAELDLRRRPAAPRRVLDAGCGTGALAEAYQEMAGDAADLTLLDPSPDMLDRARERLVGDRLTFVQGDLTRLPDLGSFDTILCAHVLEHAGDLGLNLRRLWQALRPGGSLLLAISKPHWCTALLRWRWGHKAYHPEEVIAALDAQGFDGIETVRFAKGPPSRTSCGYRAVRAGS